MKKEIFREYDIRGIYPDELDENTAYTIGQSYGSILQEKYNKNICVVGQDNRLSSPSLADNLIKGILASGCDVIDLGTVTTPMFSYACLKTNTTFGMMVTASHNPKEYNGFKFTFDNLGLARGEQIKTFCDYTFAGNFKSGNGKKHDFSIEEYYYSLIRENIEMGSRKLKVVIDPGNGTTSLFVKQIHNMFNNLEITYINDVSDGTFPNHHPDPNVAENLKMLQDKVLEINADIGISYDGDGDRVGIVDNQGQIVPTEYLMVLIIRDIVDKSKNKTFLYDIKCSSTVKDEILKLNATPYCSRTGASFTRYYVNYNDMPFGGEYSGHLFFRDRWPGFDSGIYAGLRIAEILSKKQNSLTEEFSDITKYITSPEIKINTSDDKKFTIVDLIKEEYKSLNYKYEDIDGIKVYYENGWVLVRASNTTPNITLRIEADTKENQNAINNHCMSIITKYLK